MEGKIPEKNITITGRPLSQLVENIFAYKKDSFRHEIADQLSLNKNKKWNFIALTDGLGFIDENKIKYTYNSVNI